MKALHVPKGIIQAWHGWEEMLHQGADHATERRSCTVQIHHVGIGSKTRDSSMAIIHGHCLRRRDGLVHLCNVLYQTGDRVRSSVVCLMCQRKSMLSVPVSRLRTSHVSHMSQLSQVFPCKRILIGLVRASNGLGLHCSGIVQSST